MKDQPITPPVATQADAVGHLLRRSKRDEVPLAKTFLQQGAGRIRTAGPLAALVRRRAERPLDLFLLILAGASAAPFDIKLPSPTWGRMIGLEPTPSGRSAVSRAMRVLDDLQLIRRARAGNASVVHLLDESGDGAPYEHPYHRGESYLRLPHAYWLENWHTTLTLPGKAMLLVALSLKEDFELPHDRVPDWYGMSADTAARGLNELIGHGILRMNQTYESAPLSATGWREVRHYVLQGSLRPRVRDRGLATVVQMAVGE